MTDYKVELWGKLDLKYLVIETTDFIVFIDNENTLDWATSENYDSKEHPDLKNHHAIFSQVAWLECKPNTHFPEKFTIDFKRLLGEALARSLEGDCTTALSILNNAETYLQNRGEETSREWYLSEAGKTAGVVLLAGVTSWFFREPLISIVGNIAFQLTLIAVSGALGALLSIIMRMGSERLDCHVGKNIHELESRYRIIAGMLSAVFAYLAISSGLILPFAENLSSSVLGGLFIGFLAGLTERFAPSISSKFVE